MICRLLSIFLLLSVTLSSSTQEMVVSVDLDGDGFLETFNSSSNGALSGNGLTKIDAGFQPFPYNLPATWFPAYKRTHALENRAKDLLKQQKSKTASQNTENTYVHLEKVHQPPYHMHSHPLFYLILECVE